MWKKSIQANRENILILWFKIGGGGGLTFAALCVIMRPVNNRLF